MPKTKDVGKVRYDTSKTNANHMANHKTVFLKFYGNEPMYE